MKNMIALSTAWYPPEAKSIPDAVEAGIKLGFRAFELGVSPHAYRRDEILPLVRAGDIEIVSVHNALFRHGAEKAVSRGEGLGSIDRRTRRSAVDDAMRTLDEAAELGAKAAVLHLGRVEVRDGRARHREAQRLYNIYTLSPEVKKIIAELEAERAEMKGPFVDAAMTSVQELSERAPAEVLLGIESRVYCFEIPRFEELVEVLALGKNIGYWHDTGHAEVQARFRVTEHAAWLEAYGERLAGLHLHDCRGTTDHLPPGTGEIDWDMILRGADSGVIRVMELEHTHNAESVKQAQQFLEGKGF